MTGKIYWNQDCPDANMPTGFYCHHRLVAGGSVPAFRSFRMLGGPLLLHEWVFCASEWIRYTEAVRITGESLFGRDTFFGVIDLIGQVD